MTTIPPVPSDDNLFLALIAEDDVQIALMLEMTLKTLGVDLVAVAYNIHSAKAFVQRVKPNLIICDNTLPGGPGIDFLDSVELDHPEIFRCSFSGDNLPPERLARHTCLRKPAAMSEIIHVIEMARAHTLKYRNQA